jgi:hypothetical protein
MHAPSKLYPALKNNPHPWHLSLSDTALIVPGDKKVKLRSGTLVKAETFANDPGVVGDGTSGSKASAKWHSSKRVAQAKKTADRLPIHNRWSRDFLAPVAERVRPGKVPAIVPDSGPGEVFEHAPGGHQLPADGPDRFAVAAEAPSLPLNPFSLL